MKARRFLAIAALLALAGCRSATPPRVDPPVDIPARWDAAPSESGGDLPDWGNLFDEPALAPLVAEALDANPTLAAAAARLDRALAQARIAGADLYPQAAAGVDAARRKQNFIGLPIPGAEDRVLSNTSTTFGAGFNVSWEIDLWGRLRSARTAARADASATTEDFAGARLSLGGQVAKLWFAIAEAQQQLDLATETHRSRAETAERIRRRYTEGLAPAVDVRLAESGSSAAAALVELRRRQLDAFTRQLEILLGRYPAADLEASRLPETLAEVPAGIPAEVLARRPDVRAAERRAVAASARVAQARASLYPQLRLTGSAGTSTNELDELLDGDYSVWSLVGNLLQPIFQGGRLRAGVDAASAGEREAVARFAETTLAAFGEVESSLFAQELFARQEAALAAAAEHAREAQRSAEQRYSAGLADYLLVLESQRRAYELESQLLDTRRQRLTARVDLYLALGGDAAPSALEKELQ